MHINRSIHCLLFTVVMLTTVMLTTSAASSAQVFVSVNFAPPPLPVYEQPYCPGEGYIWTPGYWAFDYDDDDYFWVPGTWVPAPEVGYLWTPGYWAWEDGRFVFYEGYWGPQVGFYGGIPYGFGYSGEGYEGGRWDHDRFFYNRAVNNVNITEIHNVYNTTVINNTTVTRVSYNGGEGGIDRRPTRQEEEAARARHIPPVAAQVQHVQVARTNPQLRASVNQGKPPIAATAKPGALNGRGVAPAKQAGAPYKPAVHPRDLPPAEHPAPANTGSSKADHKYQQQQEKLFQQQEQERQKLQQKQDNDHQRLEQQRAEEARIQQVEQQHQQQTQHMVQRQAMQQHTLQEKQPSKRTPQDKTPPRPNSQEDRPH